VTFAAEIDLNLFAQYGAIGVFLIMFVTGLVVPKWIKDYLVDRAERAEAQRDKMLKVYDQEILPTIREVVATHKEMIPAFATAAGQLKDAGNDLEKMEQTVARLVVVMERALDRLG
jgi:hypothetical protein